MFEKILIANRGEIACRVIKTARRLNIHTVAVYSDVDQQALHVKSADEAIHIGAAASSESYLRGEKIIAAAKATGAQAIHPGYGFLSENADFAEQCAESDLVFIGPPASAIRAMGSKSAAKALMEKAGVPLVPGYHGDDQSVEVLKAAADEMGYPVLLKAVAGGGGKGMRQVWDSSEFNVALDDAKREAKASFGNGDMLVEKYLQQPRHVEVQVFCDQHGNAVYLFERDCSIQRRHQKVLEEAPAPGITEDLRHRMGEAAVRAALAIDYVGAGTVEFLLDADGSFYFMEMNTRLQVEHPVTEMITGQDLVEWQLRVALGEPLPLRQEALSIHGHAFEARIYAEDPTNNFMPSTGKLRCLQTPTENDYVRVDTGVVEGDVVSPFYDPMIAKLVVWGPDRDTALIRLRAALRDYLIDGLHTNVSFLHTLAGHPALRAVELDTGFIDTHQTDLLSDATPDATHQVLASLYLTLKRHNMGTQTVSPWTQNTDWRLNQPASFSMQFDWQGEPLSFEAKTLHSASLTEYQLKLGEDKYLVSGEIQDTLLIATINGHQRRATVVAHSDGYTLFANSPTPYVFNISAPDIGQQAEGNTGDFRAPMNGTIVEVSVTNGAHVKRDDVLLVMEAMKMQHTIKAPVDGIVKEIFCVVGQLVDGGSELLQFDADA
ncbi:3-methylcrotonyl-CoA carboxylase subunit alpha [Arenicella chitinivorans]|uniref:Biotin carboxylase n=1 Tax=Arenicella chitinivorans TaxID=1329800 RepID=A0A918RG20_9GAMM|nr:acetyl/propionyl/methylcrotonyl-CoA carboxylase subunit alpha [Arenicella chitinivorans]GGZ97540.1 3-methylcrotonyl-CoA carboxylase subunit alpha [Arenicella chitinivorans]